MQHAVLVAICQPFKQLLHVTLNLRRRESCARIGQPREIVVAELHDHVDRPLAVVVLACCDREVRGHAPLQAPLPRKHAAPQLNPHAEYTRRLRLLPRSPRPPGQSAPLDVTISFSCTTFLWFNTLRILISRIAVTGNCGHRIRVRYAPAAPAPALPLSPTPSNRGPVSSAPLPSRCPYAPFSEPRSPPSPYPWPCTPACSGWGGGQRCSLQQHSACVSAGVAAPVRPLPHLLHLLVDLDVARAARGVGHVRRLPIPSTTPSAFPLRRR